MSNCDLCGDLTRFPQYFNNPYLILCPRCGDKYSKDTGKQDHHTIRQLERERLEREKRA